MDRQLIGKEAEQKALNYIRQQGLKLVTANYHCRLGEIDQIAKEKKTLVFIEVRARSHQQWGGASASVDLRKQRKIAKAAAHFLSTHREYRNTSCRFDVIAFETKPHTDTGDSCPVWYKDAFRPEATF